MTKLLLTGGLGFVGSWLIEELLANTDWDVYSLDRLSDTGRRRLGALWFSDRLHHLYHDFRAPLPEWMLKELEGVTYVVHAGAEVHGLRSLHDPCLFVESNVLGTFNLLEAARRIKPEKFIYVSSAEAVGAACAPSALDESAPLRPSNPYSAAKAAGELLAKSYWKTFGVPTIVVRTMNLFGPKQQRGKFVPDTVHKILNSESVICHIDEYGNSGSRQWLPILEFTTVLQYLLGVGRVGETYHVVGPEIDNTKIVKTIGKALVSKWQVEHKTPGPSHDMRYALKDTKLGFEFDKTQVLYLLEETARWYRDNGEWLI